MPSQEHHTISLPTGIVSAHGGVRSCFIHAPLSPSFLFSRTSHAVRSLHRRVLTSRTTAHARWRYRHSSSSSSASLCVYQRCCLLALAPCAIRRGHGTRQTRAVHIVCVDLIQQVQQNTRF
jgi:hypothetical protein